MTENVPGVKRPLPELSPALKRWIWRLAIAAAILSLIGLFTNPAVMPLMCKIYG
jgi:hypothetical protein